MSNRMTIFAALLLVFAGDSLAQTATPSLAREQWGAALVGVTHTNDQWIIAGRKRTVFLNEADLTLEVRSPAAIWKMAPSGTNDMLVRRAGKEIPIRLADAHSSQWQRYDAGFKTGVKIMLNDWGRAGDMLGLRLHLTVCLEGADEELVCDVAAVERDTVVRELNWPTALDARDIDYTLLPNAKGNLLPRDWPKEYFPIRKITNGKIDPGDHSVLQSHVIESWSMSWWGFQKGKSAMMVLVETPDDAAYQFEHHAGGPTVIGPRWLPTLGRFGYSRSVRMCFFDEGNYVTMAKRYRRYAQETGLFVSLKEKIARTPGLASLIGTPHTRLGILHNLSLDSDRYDKLNPTNNYSLTTFEERAKQLRAMKARGVERALVYISGWPHQGYDHQHPDPLPPPEAAGGWLGLKHLTDTCRELGYPFIFHDQYRDYYADAPSYDAQFAIHEEDDSLPPRAAFGSRFGDWKDEERIPWMRHWDGGRQTYLNARFQPGHLRKNYALFFAHGIRPQGIYIDVIGYVPPDEDFNPEHPTTRSDAMRGQIELLNWSRQNLGVTVTEAGSDWVIPYVDIVNQSGSVGKTVPLPLYQLVFHDAMLTTYGAARSGGEKNLLLGILCGGVPELPVSGDLSEPALAMIRKMSALHQRVALLEMTNHEFLDPDRKRERTTFADGTTVTVDWNANSVDIKPDL